MNPRPMADLLGRDVLDEETKLKIWESGVSIKSYGCRAFSGTLSLIGIVVMYAGCGGGGMDPANQRGIDAMGRGEFAKAVEEFTAVVERRPKESGAYRNRGDAYLSMAKEDPANLDKAIADYTSAIELSPPKEDLVALHERRARSYIASNRPEAAIRDVSAIIELRPKDTAAYVLRSEYRLKAKDLSGAVEDLKQAAQLSPASAVIYGKLAETYTAIGRWEEALAAGDKYLEMAEPQGKHIGYRIRGHVFFQQRQFDKAIAEYSKIVEQRPNDAQAFYDRGFAYLQLGRNETAIADFSKVIAMDPDHLLAYLQRAVSREKSDDHAGAIADLSHVIEKAPKLAGPYLQRGRLHVKNGEYQKAIGDLTTLIQLQPSAEAYRARSEAHRAAGNDKQAGEDEAKAKGLEAK